MVRMREIQELALSPKHLTGMSSASLKPLCMMPLPKTPVNHAMATFWWDQLTTMNATMSMSSPSHPQIRSKCKQNRHRTSIHPWCWTFWMTMRTLESWRRGSGASSRQSSWGGTDRSHRILTTKKVRSSRCQELLLNISILSSLIILSNLLSQLNQ